jgi:hypothetical protein
MSAARRHDRRRVRFRVVCMMPDCRHVIRKGRHATETSHGLCKRCMRKQLQQIEKLFK